MARAGHAQRLLPWRFGLFLLWTLSIPLVVWAGVEPARATLIGFDLSALVFLATLPPLFRRSSPDDMRQHSQDNDANRGIALILTIATSAAIFVAVGLEMAEDPDACEKAGIVATLLIAWLFANSVFALHYAHVFYLKHASGDRRGLDFPGGELPDYWDFAYFAFTLGMTFQTSDVNVTRSDVRRLVLWHSLAAFVFNLGILAFTINSLASGRP